MASSVSIEVQRGDITKLAIDAIVNAANTSLMGGGGVDGAIHRAGGPAILEQCRAIVARQGGCRPGEAVMTDAGDLPAKKVIHTVGPVWTEEQAEEHDRTLASCYTTSLELAVEAGLRSIAFPGISTGVYRFPKERAARVALGAVRGALRGGLAGHLERVVLVCFDEESERIYTELLA